jgi:hypothetical protein
MMKTITLLMAIVASMLIHSTQAQTCFTYYTGNAACTSGSNKFTGITFGSSTKNYNNPLFYSEYAASKSCSPKNPAEGRLSGKLPITTYKGTMTFDFFAGKDQIKIKLNLGYGTIIGGKGCFAGIRGTVSLVQSPVGYELYHEEWEFCPTAPPKCIPN